MEDITVSELNQQTRRVLDRVKAGESMEITEYGRAIARLVPVAPSTGVPLLDQLIMQGRAQPATMTGPFPPTPPVREWESTVGSLSAEILRERQEDRY
jgi:prevent-host-death family protein